VLLWHASLMAGRLMASSPATAVEQSDIALHLLQGSPVCRKPAFWWRP